MSEVTKAKFDKAVQIIESLKNVPNDGFKLETDDLLFFYRYYKQATIGDVNTKKPEGMFASLTANLVDFRETAKRNAWESVKGTPVEVCYKKYVEKLIELLKKAGDSKSLELVQELEAA
ncbi:Acbp from Moniliophthora Perniciosa [Amanita muscaria]|uniref:ACB domain-containing protein n=1 Tax=Amanita muscaria (strain Koide BX008) TaxID=946122 RepID=A0A0C2TKM7_AMAMK|nr:hypothetical protein M378DRAFT_262412 [Amanita muscaria Koide BX008]